jgi:hypothetical protein
MAVASGIGLSSTSQPGMEMGILVSVPAIVSEINKKRPVESRQRLVGPLKPDAIRIGSTPGRGMA